jgi:hypothetical protein
MALVLTLPAWQDVARLADALVEAAEACEQSCPMVARTYLDLANRIADGLDAVPDTVFVEAVEEARERRAVVRRRQRLTAVGSTA